MLELISNIIVKGGVFAEDTSLPILCKRLNLLYGRNGSGKSTIAKCLKTLSQTASDCNYTASFPDDKNKEEIFNGKYMLFESKSSFFILSFGHLLYVEGS